MARELVNTIGKFLESSGEQAVGEANVVAPFTTIQNRAKIEANCKVVGASERIRCNSLKLVPDEFGPNGEPVYTSDKEDSRIRFVGNWAAIYDSNGTYCSGGTTGGDKYVEITFYGTGLNYVGYVGNDNDIRVSIDGGPDGSDIHPTASGVLNNRNTSQNTILHVANNLTLDWHTIKITRVGGSNSAVIFGFEILNESSDLTVLSGSISKNNKEYKLESNATVPMIPTAYSGTNGGRVLTYLDEKSQVQQAVNEVGTPAYLASADHSNEAIYRKVNWREFGRNRSDDFSTLSTTTSDRAFTLDDGTTTLVGNNVQGGAGVEIRDIGTSFATLTFVGTGLDVVLNYDVTTVNTINVSVDGVSVGNLNSTTPVGATRDFVHKICSGLPYGTHTVKFSSPAEGFLGRTRLADFIIYRPKKPTVAKELPILADYNLMADFVGVNSYGESLVSQGVLRKQNIRELVYEGTWAIGSGGAVQPTVNSGFQVATTTANSKMKYTFFGTGCELRHQGQGDGATNMQVYINGLAANSTNYPSLSVSQYQNAGGSYSLTTGVADIRDASSSINAGLQFTGLPLGLYTIEFDVQSSAGGQVLNCYSIDVITPIHSPNLMIGSLGIGDERQTLSDIKTNANVDMSGARVKKSNNIAQVLQSTVATGVVHIYYEENFTDNDISISGISTIAGNRIISVENDSLRGYTVEIAHYIASTGARENGSCSVQLDGKKQKDVFKD